MEWNYKVTSKLFLSTVVLIYTQSLLTLNFDSKMSISTVISLLDLE